MIVSLIADVQRPAGVPVWWERTTADVLGEKLDRDGLDDVLECVIDVDSCFEHFVFEECAFATVYCLKCGERGNRYGRCAASASFFEISQ